MKKMIFVITFLTLLLHGSSIIAADVKKKFSIKEAMISSVVQDSLSGDVAMYWGDQPHPSVTKTIGTYKTSKRTNGFGKEKVDACGRALASVLIVFQDRAEKEGGNAVIDIKSNLKNHMESSSTEYSCLVGGIMVNVALKGTVVTLQE